MVNEIEPQEKLASRSPEEPGEAMAGGKEGARGAQAHRPDDEGTPGRETNTGTSGVTRSCWWQKASEQSRLDV